MTKTVNLIFPHQLYASSQLLDNGHDVYLIEEFLFFRQYKFHKQKIAFHRASMKYYQSLLEDKGIVVHYIDTNNRLSDITNFKAEIRSKKITHVHVIEPTDNWLESRLKSATTDCHLTTYSNPQFLSTKKELSTFFRPDKKSFYQTTFYKQQRKRLSILIDQEGKPAGGKWTFDTENRKKYPKSKLPPPVQFPSESVFWNEAVDYTSEYFSDNPGVLTNERIYPITHQESSDWFEQFLKVRFHDFGAYEDAIVKEHYVLNHSLLSPLLNVGLILPQYIISSTIEFAQSNAVPLNSTEGFIRQIIGWREFIRGMYLCKGSFSRSQNFWKFDRKIPKSFYTGSTGIPPIDTTIKKVLQTGYCHHIERLMVLGNFMLLCEFDPDEVYRWFMELFIDAYDWVMVPNIYGMSQFADGGTFATKPYIGGANYINKMGNYPKGDWEDTWNGLFWSFVIKNEEFFRSNPRMGVLVHSFNKMSPEKQQNHLDHASQFIQKILQDDLH